VRQRGGFSTIIYKTMTIARQIREQNHEVAFRLMLEELGDRAIDTAFFNPEEVPFRERFCGQLGKNSCAKSGLRPLVLRYIV
jgi:hypothetical protein